MGRVRNSGLSGLSDTVPPSGPESANAEPPAAEGLGQGLGRVHLVEFEGVTDDGDRDVLPPVRRPGEEVEGRLEERPWRMIPKGWSTFTARCG